MFEVCAALIEAVEFLEEHRVHDVGADLVVFLDEFEVAACLYDFIELAEWREQDKFDNFGDEVRALELLAFLRDDLVVDLADKGEKIRVGLVVVGLVLDQHNEVHDRHEDFFDFRDGVRKAL